MSPLDDRPGVTHEAASPPAPAPRRRFRRLGTMLIVLALLGGAGAAGWWWWGRQAATPAAERAAGAGRRGGGGAPVPVTVSAAQRQDVPITLDAIGTVQALNTITVRAQVDGQLVEVAFTEGQEVKAGDLLARIDQRTYQAALDQATAKKAQDEAMLANARLDLQRYTTLARSDGVSRQQADTQRATVAQNEAQVAADQAAIDNARALLSYTTIGAPIAGRLGLRLVDPGNLVRATDATGIVTITQVQPMGVVFTLPQQDLGRVLDALRRGPVPVTAVQQSASGPVSSGTLLTLDNQVDPTTGTIKLKASFPNEDRRLWPGAFVTVHLQVDTVKDATTIPLVAVQRGPDGAYAFLLRPDRTVEQRPLTLGPLTEQAAVVTKGLAVGDQVVTSGALRLSPGAQVALAGPPPEGGAPQPPA
ncbi:MAG TPA: efflux RND transporter periplasmic adaptor subunit, partial [Crenalkalicoccus sp.]|nr:efflux RND transporter periplasmic adaptor subunit [Crenalkalicoccus sp.]